MNYKLILPALSLLLISYFMGRYYIVYDEKLDWVNYTNYTYPGYTILGSVKHMVWNREKELANVFSKRGSPLILKNTTVNDWKIMSLWTPEYLSNTIDRKINISLPLEGCNGELCKVVALFRDHLPLGNLDYLHFDAPSRKVEMHTKDMWNYIQNPQLNEEYRILYSSGNIELYPEIAKDLPNFDWLITDRNKPITIMLWMGSKGATAPSHYDKSHNFFVQINGKKRFILSPPEEHHKFHLYPSLHPMRLQSQIKFLDLSERNLKNFPDFQSVVGYEAVLESGYLIN
eukprot:TRINITY_DN966_c0_g1_i3.p1 TRINITY_DN966_c0_g1~~TRINITY_DN966_c0_g1_i3.p1  ORF type:complete len:287 (+),score=32.14 TRINITY_DN966_c0_g1_i3:10-870(+)